MLNLLFKRVSSRPFDLAILEWVSAAGAILVLVCGVLFVERLWLDGVGLLVGYSLVLLLTLAMIGIALLAALLRRLSDSPPPADGDRPARRHAEPPEPETRPQAAS